MYRIVHYVSSISHRFNAQHSTLNTHHNIFTKSSSGSAPIHATPLPYAKNLIHTKASFAYMDILYAPQHRSNQLKYHRPSGRLAQHCTPVSHTFTHLNVLLLFFFFSFFFFLLLHSIRLLFMIKKNR